MFPQTPIEGNGFGERGNVRSRPASESSAAGDGGFSCSHITFLAESQQHARSKAPILATPRFAPLAKSELPSLAKYEMFVSRSHERI
jgi:hypothetical protein